MKILVMSPPPATCAPPGPWQLSQPCREGPPFVSKVVFQCAVFSQLLYSSAWQVLQVSDPRYSAAVSAATAAAAPGALFCGAAAGAAAVAGFACGRPQAHAENTPSATSDP